MNIGTTITALRKNHGWSQTDLGKKANVSREIIGRYERNDTIPSIEVAKRIADAFDVSLDFLAGQGKLAQYDKAVIKRIEDIEALDGETKSKLFFLIDNITQNFKAKQAYGA